MKDILRALAKTTLFILGIPFILLGGLFFGLVIMPFITLKEAFDEIWVDVIYGQKEIK